MNPYIVWAVLIASKSVRRAVAIIGLVMIAWAIALPYIDPKVQPRDQGFMIFMGLLTIGVYLVAACGAKLAKRVQREAQEFLEE
jgi:peptidoglycan/LPS O-acetylase OafA/YrhL